MELEKKMNQYTGKVAFAIGTGRCGTNFIHRVLKLEPLVTSSHERYPLNDAFQRYCKWYDLKVDSGGFLAIKEAAILEDLKKSQLSFESSHYLSFSIHELYKKFDARFILLIRQPDKVVNSFSQKGWYANIVRSDSSLPLGYQPGSETFPQHSFGRIVPFGTEADKWHKYTQVGKIAWYWRVVNTKIIQSFEQLPKTHWRIIKLEELSYEKYKSEVASFLGLNSSISRQKYERLVNEKPGKKLSKKRSIQDWNEQERREFESEVAELAKELGYEWRIDRLCSIKETKSQTNDMIEIFNLSLLKRGANKIRKILKL